MEQAASGPGIRAAAVLDLLEERYGRSRFISRFDPMEELVSCILSQSSSDASSFPAFTRLREAYPDWAKMEEAGPDALVDLIKAAGLGPSKSRAIVDSLRLIREKSGGHSLEFLRGMPDLEARGWLSGLPGVGLKTASIVLAFAFGRPLIPVDTHVLRVSQRLGFVGPKTTPAKAHDGLLAVVLPKDAFRFHTLMIQHGRLTCLARNPLCSRCPAAGLCPSAALME